jgi:predicted kinase
MKHRYLFILEVAPVEVGKTYEELPSHLTLMMSRFFSDLSPEQMSEVVKPLFSKTVPIVLTFGETTELGPKKLTVHMIEHNQELKQLHQKLRTLLDSINVEYEYPQFIGENHKPHVTKRPGIRFDAGEKKIVRAAYLVEIVDSRRVIRSKFGLSGNGTKQLPHSPMLVFISGSINSGKTTTSKLLAKELGATLINVDDLNDTIPNFNLATDLDKSMDLAIAKINEYLAEGKDVVANYVVRQRDFDRFAKEINTKEQFVITLSPRLEVAQRKRGDRVLSDWEVARVKHHYDTGVATPMFGHAIDNSDINIEEAVELIRKIIGR